MKKYRVISCLSSFVGLAMICIGMLIMKDEIMTVKVESNTSGMDVKNVAANANMIVKEVEPVYEEVVDTVEEVEMETLPAAVVETIPERVEVYDGLTMEELADKLNRNLGWDILSGYGYLIASESLSRGVDPYLVVAIISQESGCAGSNGCSNLASACYNFGGIKGNPGCNGKSFKQYDSIEDGLIGLIDLLDRVYFSRGLTTPEAIGPIYCEGDEWAGHISWFINKIRNN